eukprot:5733154-Karenia_brevis.AAC.1
MLQPNSYKPSQALIYTFMNAGYDLDPNMHILWKRIHILRRAVAKRPRCEKDIRDLLQHYQRKKVSGTKHEDLVVDTQVAAPPPGAANRRDWKANDTPMGPVALLLQQLHYFAFALDANTC